MPRWESQSVFPMAGKEAGQGKRKGITGISPGNPLEEQGTLAPLFQQKQQAPLASTSENEQEKGREVARMVTCSTGVRIKGSPRTTPSSHPWCVSPLLTALPGWENYFYTKTISMPLHCLVEINCPGLSLALSCLSCWPQGCFPITALAFQHAGEIFGSECPK